MSRTEAWDRRFSAFGVVFLTLALAGAGKRTAAADLDRITPFHAESAAPTAPHITLDASQPEDDQTVAGNVTEVRLFFSEAPLMRGASIRVVNSSRRLVRSSPPEADTTDPRQLAVQIEPALPEGRYVVQWRCIADDGHVMRGDFTFEVAGT